MDNEEETTLSLMDVKTLKSRGILVIKNTSKDFIKPSTYMVNGKTYEALEDVERIRYVSRIIDELSFNEFVERHKLDKKTKKYLLSQGYKIYSLNGGSKIMK